MNLKSLLTETAQRYPEKIALIQGPRRLSYAELEKNSNRLAHALLGLGIRKGDRVAVMLNNSPEYVTVYFGIFKIGAIAVPLDTRYRVEELAAVFGSCPPGTFISEKAFLENLGPALSRFPHIRRVIDVSPEPDARFLSYHQLLAASPEHELDIPLSPEDIAVINYTSGPTSAPHGAMLSHDSLTTDAAMSGDAFQQTERDVVMLFALPLYHQFGLVTVMLCSISRGSTIVMVPGTGISINSLMASIEKEKGTILLGVPYIFALAAMMAMREGISNDLSSLRLCLSGGAPLTVNVIRQFKKYYGLTLGDIWGLTEAASHVTGPLADKPGKIGTIGRPMPGWELRIVDEHDKELPADEPGEIIVKGPIMSGYYRNEKATRRTVRNGWLYTGDIGLIDEEGFVHITGRKKKMIILKGQNVYPADIEKILLENPRIAAAKVVGIPDKLRGEVVAAIITPRYGEKMTDQEIRQYCQGRMADFKCPKQIIFTDAPEPIFARYANIPLKRYLARLSHPSPYHGVEEILRSHPKVAEARVTSIPDRLRGEILKAVIRIKGGEKVTEEEIRLFCRKRFANYRFLQKITFTKAKS